jgi:hypothetical protein
MGTLPGVERSFMEPASRFSQGALQARSAMRPNVTNEPPGKTAGGAISSAAGMGMAGYMAGGMVGGSAAGPYGAAIGAAVGLGAYLLS